MKDEEDVVDTGEVGSPGSPLMKVEVIEAVVSEQVMDGRWIDNVCISCGGSCSLSSHFSRTVVD